MRVGRILFLIVAFVLLGVSQGWARDSLKVNLEFKLEDGVAQVTNKEAAKRDLRSRVADQALDLAVVGQNLPSGLKLVLGDLELQPVSSAPDRIQWEILAGALNSGPTLKITLDTVQVFVITFESSSTQGAGIPAGPGPTSRRCSTLVDAVSKARTYFRDQNRVELYFGPTGERVSSMPPNIDANDDIVFFLIAPASKIDNYQVQVTSGSYDPSFLNLYLGAEVPKAVSQSVETCERRRFDLGRFTTPTVTVDIKYAEGEDKWTKIHTLRINPLYHGTVRVGLVKSQLVDREYGLDQNMKIFEKDSGSSEGLLFVEYVPFMFSRGGRDLLKRPTFAQRISLPVIGVGLNNPGENFFVGIEVDLARGLSLAAGAHYGKVTRLADDLAPGDMFTGAAEDIPLTSDWETELYVGVSIDLLIFSKAFKGLLTGG